MGHVRTPVSSAADVPGGGTRDAAVIEMRARFAFVIAIAPLVVGCYPTLPPHLAEGTEVLAPGRVSVNIAGGATSVEANCCAAGTANEFAAGFEARLRTGLRYNQEIGVSAMFGMGTN